MLIKSVGLSYFLKQEEKNVGDVLEKNSNHT
jgi:hypothetical protein